MSNFPLILNVEQSVKGNLHYNNIEKNKNFMYKNIARSNCNNCDFSNSNLDYVSFRGAHFKFSIFFGYSFKYAEFIGTNLKDREFMKNAVQLNCIFHKLFYLITFSVSLSNKYILS
jgi:uncharacterized protein YjbI with pentapeptide repeats